jgi:hypothetical protein
LHIDSPRSRIPCSSTKMYKQCRRQLLIQPTNQQESKRPLSVIIITENTHIRATSLKIFKTHHQVGLTTQHEYFSK